MKNTILITLALIFATSNLYAGGVGEKEREILKRINKYSDKIDKLKCYNFETIPQKNINKCMAYSISYIIAELDYTDLVHVMTVDRLGWRNKGLYTNKKPRDFWTKK